MLGLNPISISRDKPLSREEIAQALRWAIEAELDAINFYEQFATFIEDENVRKVFLDIAREEKAHVGEFLALLLNLDDEQVKELKGGFEEVKELTGIETELDSSSESVNSDYIEKLNNALISAVSRSRVLLSHLPVTKVIGLQSVRVDIIESKDGVRVVKQEYKPIPLLSRKFYVGLRELSDGSFDPAIAVKAGELLVKEEENLIISEVLSSAGVRLKLREWTDTEEAIEDLMNALQEVSKTSRGPFAIILNPKRYAKLLKVHERSGKMLIEILREVFKGGIIVTPNIKEDKVVVLANTPSVIDVVIGQDVNLKELGPEGDVVAFLVSQALTVRVKDPNAIAVLEP
ncbi:hypothetical protein PNA2_1598 [Pyrococcus sp. NA2]|uniref:encapsulin n=1 Tax=Pyrococcus sp. (strain NA2) TaxID=342949 RepID=UPI000209A9AC|nr:family 1 encapsulin nanocompartment shell protein [Pyrococcus sp. NA2]AEC52513.1 hypothetical protein PNA2_1598 [Pyrococcus sp. NA2]